MPSRDTISSRITEGTKQELERIREAISRDLGIDKNLVTLKHADIVLRIKSSRGKIYKSELNDIILGKIK